MRNSFATNGLPQLEQSVLLSFGYSQEEIDSLGVDFATVPDEYYYETDQMPGLLGEATNWLDSLPGFFLDLPGGPILADLGTDPDTWRLMTLHLF